VSTCKDAERAGHLEILEWARENGVPKEYNTSRLLYKRRK
jgi:hypothetical protein